MFEFLIKIHIFLFLCGFVAAYKEAKKETLICFNCNSHYDTNCDHIPRKVPAYGMRLRSCTGGCAIMKGQWGNENYTLTRRALFWRGCTSEGDTMLCTQHSSVCCRCYSNYCNYGIDCTELFATNLCPKISLIVLSFIVLLVY